MIQKPKKERRFLKILGKVGEILVQELLIKVGKSLIQKIGGKKNLPSIIFLLLFYNIAYASIDSIPYPITGNKQRLGWQTTGNGLVYRGRSNDTITKPTNYVDKNVKAYLILDSVRGTIFVWRQTYWDSLLVGGGGLTMPFDSITFNTAKDGTVGVGEVEYNDTQGSLIQGLKGGNVTNVIGQQLHQRVNNRTGAPLAKGDVVYLSGSQGNRITVAKALATSDPTSANTFGIVAESIADNASGYVITEGLITGLNTSALTQDSAVYLSGTTAGALTSTKPQAPIHGVYIGVCVKSNAGSGELFCKIRNGLELDELHDVQITSPVNNASLYYKSSEGLWRDTTAALLVSDTASMLIPYLRKLDTITLSNRINTKLNISDTASMLLPYLRDADTVTLSNRINLKLNIADTSAFARDNQISGTSGQVAYFNSSSSVVSDTALRWSAANKSLGINMTTVPSGASLILKNSQEPVRTTVVATQTFAADTTNWTRGAGWTFNGTQAVATAATGDLTYTPALTITSGNAYEITYTLSNYTAGTLTARFGNATAVTLPTHNATNNIVVLLPTASTGGFRFNTSTFTGNLDNISVVQIANPSPILLAGQDDNSTTLYNALRMPNSSTITFGNTAGIYTTGLDNVFIGRATANNNTTGNSNVFIGSEIGTINTSGRNNVFIGKNVGIKNTTGVGNIFIGTDNGVNNTTGAGNNFFGNNVGLANITGNNNSFFGSSSGRDNSTGDSNTFFGFQSGFNNTGGSNNTFIGGIAGKSNTTGDFNTFFGAQAGENSLTGSNNVFIGRESGKNNTSGSTNVFIGREAGFNNRAGLDNVSLGTISGRNIKGNYNVSLGYGAGDNSVIADTTTGSNNILIGFTSGNNIAGAASGNVAIGNAVDLPTNNGSNQGVYQNVLFFTGASGTQTTIAAASKAGIKTNAPNRDLEVAGEVRITDLTTDAPTRLVGADADGDLGQVTLGAGLSLASSSLLADTSFLVTRFDTASMLTAYFRDADTTSLNLTSRFAAKLNISDTTSMLTNYLRSGVAASTYLPLTGGTLTGALNGTTGTFTGLNVNNTTTEGIFTLQGAGNNTATRIQFKTDNIVRQEIIKPTSASNLQFRSYPTGTAQGGYEFYVSNGLTESLAATIATDKSLSLTGTLGVTGATTLGSTLAVTGNITEDGNNVLTTLDTISLSNRINNKQSQINGTGFVKASGTSITYDNSSYLRTGLADSTYLPLTGGTLTGGLTGTTANFSGNVGIGTTTPQKHLEVIGNINDYVSVGVRTLAPYNFTGVHFGYRENNSSFRKSAIVFQRNDTELGGGDASGKIHILNVNFGNAGQSATLADAKLTISNTGRVGIKDTTPTYDLSVNGTLGVTSATTLSAPLTVNSSAVFNEGSADADFRVESDGNANMVFVDASTDRVGIGYASPTKTLDVNGTLGVFGATNLSNTLTVDGKTILNDSVRFEGNILFKKNMGLPIVKISNADYTATTSNHTIIYTTLTADKTLTIPNAADAVGVKFVISIFDIPEGNEALTLVTPGSNLFVRTDGENSSVDIVGGFCTTIQSDGTKWYILSYAPMY